MYKSLGLIPSTALNMTDKVNCMVKHVIPALRRQSQKKIEFQHHSGLLEFKTIVAT